MRLRTGLIALALVGSLALGGCGGGSQEATTASQATVAQRPKPQASESKPEGQKDTPAPAPTHAPSSPDGPAAGSKTPAPGVPTTPEGDNSIQAFGAEGDAGGREQATADLRTYLMARAAGEWSAACAAASAQYKSELAKAISRTPEEARPRGCAETLSALFGEAPKAPLRSAAQVGQVLSFRVREDGYAYLIFKGVGGTIKFIAMADDGGAWKVNTIEPAEFPGGQGDSQ